MGLRATLSLRNNKMIEARKQLGPSQPACVEACGVPVSNLRALEAMDYSDRYEDVALRVASLQVTGLSGEERGITSETLLKTCKQEDG